MTDLRRADPAARRQAVLFLVVAVGALGDRGLRAISHPQRDGVLADPGASAHRVKSVFLLVAALVLAPLLVFASRGRGGLRCPTDTSSRPESTSLRAYGLMISDDCSSSCLAFS